MPIVCLALLASCGGGSDEEFAPGAPTITLNLTDREITWDSIAGADSYNLYILQVEDCPDIDTATFQYPTTADTKVEDVSSPFSIETYKGCTTCYYAALAAENEAGESELSQPTGWQIRNCP